MLTTHQWTGNQPNLAEKEELVKLEIIILPVLKYLNWKTATMDNKKLLKDD